MENKISAAFAFLLAIAMMAFINEPKKKLKDLSSEVIISWNLISHQVMAGEEDLPGKDYQPLPATRVHAMVHIAMHDALNAINSVYETYALKAKVRGADPEAAAASAAYTVLLASFPEKKALLDNKLSEWVHKVKSAGVRAKSIEIGQQAAAKVLELRKKDGVSSMNLIGQLHAPVKPGIYQVVPPMNFVYAPEWKTMNTFSLSRYDQFRCPPPPALTSKTYTDAFNEVKEFGGKQSSRRTADQTFYAKFWYELSEIGWNRIGRIVAADRKMDLYAAARMFALLNMAIADAYTAGWDSKFHYNFWRPYTAIHFADADENPVTAIDNNWESLEVTPPIHDYPSTHSALGNAGASVLAAVFGDQTAFTMTSGTSDPKGATRSFKSFSQAANENADSRVMAGLHFRFSCNAGQELGNKIGQWTVQNHLKPLKK
jgi:hypothetical protein